MLVVFTSVPASGEGLTLAEKLIEAKLAACVQIVPQIASIYEWEGVIQKENEQLLLIKTSEEKYAELEAFITEHHSYDVPEIVAIDAEHVSTPYLSWMREYLSE